MSRVVTICFLKYILFKYALYSLYIPLCSEICFIFFKNMLFMLSYSLKYVFLFFYPLLLILWSIHKNAVIGLTNLIKLSRVRNIFFNDIRQSISCQDDWQSSGTMLNSLISG